MPINEDYTNNNKQIVVINQPPSETTYRMCGTCGFEYPQEMLVYRNGLLQCTVAGPKSKPCLDEPGFRESITMEPLIIDPPEEGGFEETY